MAKELSGYELSRNYWDFAFSNPEKVKPYHAAIFFFAVEHCNRLGWKQKFGFPTTMVMEATGIKSYNSYKKYFDELCEWGMFNIIELSKNQYSSNIIALSLNDEANNEASNKALDKASIKHTTKQSESTGESKYSINKPITINNEQLNNEPINETDFVSGFLVPDMWDIFIKHNPNYPGLLSQDAGPLLNIAKYICKKEKLDDKRPGKEKEKILPLWEKISEQVIKDPFTSNYQLSQVEKYIVSIIQKIQNGANSTKNKGLSAERLREAHARTFGGL